MYSMYNNDLYWCLEYITVCIVKWGPFIHTYNRYILGLFRLFYKSFSTDKNINNIRKRIKHSLYKYEVRLQDGYPPNTHTKYRRLHTHTHTHTRALTHTRTHTHAWTCAHRINAQRTWSSHTGVAVIRNRVIYWWSIGIVSSSQPSSGGGAIVVML